MARKQKLNKRFVALLIALGVLLAMGGAAAFVMTRPVDPKAMFEKASEQLKKKEYAEACTNFRIAAQSGRSAEYFLAWGNALLERVKEDKTLVDSDRSASFGQARAAVRQALVYDGKSTEAMKKLLEMEELIAGQSNDWKEYISLITRLLELDSPDKPVDADHQLLFKRAQVQAHLAETQSVYVEPALQDFAKLIELDAKKEDYRISLARFHVQQKQNAEAERVFVDGLKANEDSVYLRIAYADFLVSLDKQKDKDKALALLKEAKQKKPDNIESYIQLSAFYQREKQPDKAMAELEEALAKDSTEFRIYLRQSSLYMMQQQPDKAQAALTAGLEALRKSVPEGTQFKDARERMRYQEGIMLLNYNLADAFMEGMVSQAEKDARMPRVEQCLSEMKGVYAESPLVLTVQGRLAIINNNLDEAEKLLERAYKTGREIKAGLLLYQVYNRRGQSGLAKNILEGYLPVLKDDAGGMLSLIKMYLESRQYERAVPMLEEVLKKHPDNAPAKALMASVNIARGQANAIPPDTKLDAMCIYLIRLRADELAGDEPDTAVALLENLLKLEPKAGDAYLQLFWLYQGRGMTDKAAEVKKQAEAFFTSVNDPGAVERIRLGTIPDKVKAREQELEIIRKIADPLQRELTMFDFFFTAGEYDKAAEHLNTAKAANPDSPETVARSFDLALVKSDFAAAQKVVEQAQKSNLDKAGGRLYKALLAKAQKDNDTAIAALNEVVQERPAFSAAHAILGDCYVEKEQLDRAWDEYQLSYSQDPKNVKAVLGLVRVAERTGRLNEYNAYLTHAYRLMPRFPEIREKWLEQQALTADPQQIVKRREKDYERNPNDLVNLSKLAALYERVKRDNDAEKAYRTLVGLAPHNAGYVRQLADFLRRTNREVDARGVLVKYAEAATDKEKIPAYMLLAEHLESTDKLNEAKTMYEQALKIDTDGRVYLVMAGFHERQRQYAEAAKCQEEYLKKSPKASDARLAQVKLVRYLILGEDYSAAAKKVDEMLAANRADADALTLKGLMLMQKKEYAKAREALDDALRADQQHQQALLYRAQTNWSMGERAMAIEDLEGARRTRGNQTPPEMLLMLSAWYRSVNDYISADSALQALLKAYPEHLDGLKSRAELCLQAQRWQQLEETLQAGRKAHPREYVWSIYEHEMLRKLGKTAEAIAELKKAGQAAPPAEQAGITMAYAEALLEQNKADEALKACEPYKADVKIGARATALSARALAKLNKLAEADADFSAALKAASADTIQYVVNQMETGYGRDQAIARLQKWVDLRADKWRIQFQLARLMLDRQEPDAAMSILNQVLPQATEKTEKIATYDLIAMAYYLMGKMAESTQAFSESLNLDRSNGPALNNYAWALAANMGKFEDALAYSEQAVKQMPNNPNVLDTCGMILVEVGKLKEAEDVLRKAVKLQPIASSYLYLGKSLEKQSRKSEAMDQYKTGWELIKSNAKDPMYPKLKQSIEQLGGKVQ